MCPKLRITCWNRHFACIPRLVSLSVFVVLLVCLECVLLCVNIVWVICVQTTAYYPFFTIFRCLHLWNHWHILKHLNTILNLLLFRSCVYPHWPSQCGLFRPFYCPHIEKFDEWGMVCMLCWLIILYTKVRVTPCVFLCVAFDIKHHDEFSLY